MADQPKGSDDSWWSKLAGFAREVGSITDPNVMYGKMYNQYLSHTDDPEKAAELARRGTDLVSGSMGRNKAIWSGLGYMNPVTAQAMIVNQIQEAAGAETLEDAGKAGALAIAPNVAGKTVKAPTMARGATSGAPPAAPGFADGGDVSKALSVIPPAPEADPVGMAKSVMAQPRPTLTPGQQKLMQSFQAENQPAAVISPKPGTGSTEDRPGFNYATAIPGHDMPPPVQAPVREKPRLSNIANHVQKQMKTKGFRDLVRDVAGIHSMDVTPTTGSWLGEVEPSFIIKGYGPNGENASPEQIRKLSHLLGFGYQQDAVVEHHHNPNLEEGVPTMYVGKGSKLSQGDIDNIHEVAKAHGLDFTRTGDGMGVKFSHFDDEEKLPEFIQKVQSFAQKANMPDILGVRTSGDLKYAKGYLDEIFREHAVPSGTEDGSARSPDIFRRIVDHVLAPYAKAVASEGYRLSPDRLGELYGLAPEEVNYLRDSLLPKKSADRSTVPLMTGDETLVVRPTGKKGENTVDDVLYALQNRAAQRGQIDPDDHRDETKKLIAKTMADEVEHHVNTSEKSAIGWYDSALKRAKDKYSEVFPEIKSDPEKGMMFDAILGITSQGNDVHANSVFASRLYNDIRDGKMSLSEAAERQKGTFGEQTRAIEYNLKKLDHLLNQNGFDKMRDVFNQTKTVAEWRKALKSDKSLYGFDGKPLDIQGQSDQKVTGWMVFGPKIGSFINNLHGDYSTLTADLWFSRTYNRMLGQNFLHTPLQEAKQYRDFRDALLAEHQHNRSDDTLKTRPYKTVSGKTQYDPKGNPKQWDYGTDTKDMTREELEDHLGDPDLMLEKAKEVYNKYVKSGYKDKSDLRRRAKNWIENRYDPVAAPRGDEERGFQQKVAEEAQNMLKKRGLDISVADIQAALWFHEKELFGKHGVASTRSAPADYADAATRAVELHKAGRLYDKWSDIQAEIKAEQKAKRQAEKDQLKAEKAAQRKAARSSDIEPQAFADGGEVERYIPHDDNRRTENLEKFHGKTPDAIKGGRWLHGTTSNFQTFRKSPSGTHQTSGAIFVTRDPNFADEYAKSHWGEEEFADDRAHAKEYNRPPLQPNVMPVHVRAENPFDFENPDHVEAVLKKVDNSRLTDNEVAKLPYYISRGDWEIIEDPAVQMAIKDMGHDSFFVKENGVKNLGVYDPSQLKSATGNQGTFDQFNSDITKADGGEVDRLKMSHKDVTQRIPQLTEAAQKLGTDEMTPEMYQELVNKHKPVHPWDHVPEPATYEEISGAVRENQRPAVGKGHLIPEGHPVGLRLDIPAYKDYGVWAPTIHDRSGEKSTVLAHEPVAHISNAEFRLPESKALKVAQGTSKSPFATIDGSWNPTHPNDIHAMAQEYLDHPEWSQVGMDPERHSYFYDRRTQEPITHADEVLQVGPLVLAKNAKSNLQKKDFKFQSGGDVEPFRPKRPARKRPNSSVVDKALMLVSRKA